MLLPLEDTEGRERLLWAENEFCTCRLRFLVSVVHQTAPGIRPSKPRAGRRDGTSELLCRLVTSVHMVGGITWTERVTE